MAALCIAAALLIWAVVPAAAQVSQREVSPRLRQLLEARDFSGAERMTRQELEGSPRWEAGYLLLAQLYTQGGRYELAERAADAAIHIRESLDGFLLLAVATMRLNRLNDSIGWLEKAARRWPDSAEIYKVLGLDYALGGVLSESEAAFRRAAELAPENWEYHYLRGRALFELGRAKESLDSLRRAVQRNASSAKAWTALGQAQERLGDYDLAEASYGKAAEVCGSGRECAWPLLQLGFLYGRKSGPEEAARYFRRALAARPDWARPHFHLGKALVALDDMQGARKELEEAVRLDKDQSEYHYQLSQVYRELGDTQNAHAQLAMFRSLVDLDRNARPVAEFTEP